MEHYPTMRVNYRHHLYYPKIVIDRSNQTGPRRKNEYTVDMMMTDKNAGYEAQTKTKTIVEDSKLVVERYDENGKLIRVSPPGYIPFGHLSHSILV